MLSDSKTDERLELLSDEDSYLEPAKGLEPPTY